MFLEVVAVRETRIMLNTPTEKLKKLLEEEKMEFQMKKGAIMLNQSKQINLLAG